MYHCSAFSSRRDLLPGLASMLRPLACRSIDCWTAYITGRTIWRTVFATKTVRLSPPNVSLWREIQRLQIWVISMESLPDDLKRIIAAFAGPAAGARQVAARARTLNEFVEYRLATASDHSYERTTIRDGIANTCAHVKLVHALRIVSKQWRDTITYGSARQLTLRYSS